MIRSYSALVGTAFVVGLALTLAACGSSQKGSTGPTTKSTSSNTPAQGSGSSSMVNVPSDFCAIVTTAEITRVMGHAVPAVTPLTHHTCDNQLTASGSSLVTFQISVYPPCQNRQPASSKCLSFQASVFSSAKTVAQNPITVSGVGDQAFCIASTVPGEASHEFDVLKGWILLTTSADTCAHAQALASLILSKL